MGAFPGTRSRITSRLGIAGLLAAAAMLAVSVVPVAAHADAPGPTNYSFESDAVGTVPAGCTTPATRAPATVSAARAFDGSHSLEVHDTSASTVVVTTCQGFSQQGAEMSVEVYPANALGLAIDVDGLTDHFVSVDNGAVFHLRVASNGSMTWYDGHNFQTLAPSGTVPQGRWSLVQITVPTDNSAAYVGVNGEAVGTAGPAQGTGNPIRSITGFGFASLGASSVGDDGFFDSISFGPGNAAPLPGVPATHDFATGTVDGFESDALGAVPAGCGTPAGSIVPTVTDARAFAGQHSVHVASASPTSPAVLTCATPAQHDAYFAFAIDPVSLAAGELIEIRGDTLTVSNTAVFHFWVKPDGSILWSDGVSWRSVAPAGTVPMDKWSKVQIVTPADVSSANNTAYFTVDGTYVGSGGPTIGNNHTAFRAIADITGFAFTGATGDDIYLDDVEFGTAADAPASATSTPPFEIGPTSTMIDTGLAQDPSSAVVVPHGGGTRILATYTGHPDNSTSSGTGLFYSDDDGTTWVDDQASNPMPDSAEFFMTLLRNGDILAVGFHTTITPGTNDEQAQVDTAISHDDGDTWTLQAGTLTTPEPMRALAAGTTLGFALVHSVIEDPDGTLYQSAYGYYATDRRYRQIVMVSHDEGLNWTVRSTVAAGDVIDPSGPVDGIAEGAMARVADGSFLMILRNGSYAPLSYTRSTDNGLTWSAPQELAIGAAAEPLESIFPTLQLLPTGQLVLLVGRPGLVMTVSADGLGDDWSTPVGLDYVNSENAVFQPLSPSTLMVLGDQGNVAPWRVWSRNVAVDQPCTQTVTGTHNGPLTAGAGGLCLDGATVNGPITVTGGGRLVVQGSTIRGAVSATGASLVSLCGSNVAGPVTLSSTTGIVTVGDTVRTCDPDAVTGPLRITGSTGQVVVDRSRVTGPVTITGNTAALPTVLSGLTVTGPLSCSGNSAAPTASGVANSVTGPAGGQCAALG
jgi:hypothetical protein